MIYQKIESILTPILISNQSIGFMISGGFDSGLLLYVCSKIKQQKNLKCSFRVFTVPRHDDSLVHSKRIVEWVNKEFNNQIKIMMTGDPDLHHSRQVWSGTQSAKNQCDVLLLGDTTNPDCLPNGPDRKKVNDKNIIQPFFDLTKKETVKLAVELNLVDLMKLSHTCTESNLLRCGLCWQCQERKWGFDQNSYSDPGTM